MSRAACPSRSRPSRRSARRRATGGPSARRSGATRGVGPLAGLRGGHVVVAVLREDAAQRFALVGLGGHEGVLALDALERPFLRVEAEVALAALVVRPVAEEAIVREDGADVALEVDDLIRL